MKDVISVNRQYLLMARAAAEDPSGALVTGVPRAMLSKIGSLTLEEIEQLAHQMPASVMTIRFSESEFDRLVTSARSGTSTQYALSLVASQPIR